MSSPPPAAPSTGAPSSGRRWQWPHLAREDRWVGGVASGIAAELGVQSIVIRAAFVVLATAGGWGLVIYAVAWATLAIVAARSTAPRFPPAPKAATPAHRLAGVVLVTLGLLFGLVPLTSSVFAVVVWPVGILLSGMLVAWTRADDGGAASVVRVVAGLLVAIAGFSAFVFTRVELADALIALILAAAVVGGIGLVAAPSIVRMGRDLDRERLERARSDERARVNAHLHDSVLQTLTLIQQQSDDPGRIRRIARRQERELRTWLYGTPATTVDGLRLGPALEHAASEVESDTDVIIDLVTVGDVDDVDPERVAPLIAATKEAMRNAAHHSGAERVSVYVEHRAGQVDVFVRDEGAGFDPDGVGHDRHGIADSIIGRLRAVGGTATIQSEPGVGTEVELSLPVPDRSVGAS